MTKNKLVVACLAALGAFATTGCGDPKCDPECGAGYTCNTEVDPPVCEAVSACNPACAAGQTCDTTKNPPVCVTPSTTCSPSCKNTEHCDTTGATPTCVANTCPTACGANQRCDTHTNPGTCVDKVPCDPGCPAGTVCNPTANNGEGVCECNPACGEGQVCNLLAVPPKCEEICNKPRGCGELEVCNTTTLQCEPVTCGTTQCQQGEGCFNPTTGAPGGNTCTCLPETETEADTCVEYDMVCDYDFDNPRASHCKIPGEYDTCNPNAETACETGLDCVDYSGDGSWYTCLKPCTNNTACGADRGSYCDDGHCKSNYCSIPELWAGQYTEAQWRSLFFQRCPVNAAGETNDENTWKGTCVPYPYNYNGRIISLGVCEEFGTAPTGGECDQDASRENMAAVCGFNESCIQIQPGDTAQGAAHPYGGMCVPNCNAAANPDPANTCSNYCLDISGVDDEAFNKTRWGFCLAGCNPLGTDTCSADIFGNERGCTDGYVDGTHGYCWSLTNPAAAENATCVAPAAEDDNRSSCADRTVCLKDSQTATTAHCYGFCNLASCTEGTVCPTECGGQDLYCINVGFTDLGYCYPTAE